MGRKHMLSIDEREFTGEKLDKVLTDARARMAAHQELTWESWPMRWVGSPPPCLKATTHSVFAQVMIVWAAAGAVPTTDAHIYFDGEYAYTIFEVDPHRWDEMKSFVPGTPEEALQYKLSRIGKAETILASYNDEISEACLLKWPGRKTTASVTSIQVSNRMMWFWHIVVHGLQQQSSAKHYPTKGEAESSLLQYIRGFK